METDNQMLIQSRACDSFELELYSECVGLEIQISSVKCPIHYPL